MHRPPVMQFCIGGGGGWLDQSTQRGWGVGYKNPPPCNFWGDARVFTKHCIDPGMGELSPRPPPAILGGDICIFVKGCINLDAGALPPPNAVFGVMRAFLQRVALTQVQESTHPPCTFWGAMHAFLQSIASTQQQEDSHPQCIFGHDACIFAERWLQQPGCRSTPTLMQFLEQCMHFCKALHQPGCRSAPIPLQFWGQ